MASPSDAVAQTYLELCGRRTGGLISALKYVNEQLSIHGADKASITQSILQRTPMLYEIVHYIDPDEDPIPDNAFPDLCTFLDIVLHQTADGSWVQRPHLIKRLLTNLSIFMDKLMDSSVKYTWRSVLPLFTTLAGTATAAQQLLTALSPLFDGSGRSSFNMIDLLNTHVKKDAKAAPRAVILDLILAIVRHTTCAENLARNIHPKLMRGVCFKEGDPSRIKARVLDILLHLSRASSLQISVVGPDVFSSIAQSLAAPAILDMDALADRSALVLSALALGSSPPLTATRTPGQIRALLDALLDAGLNHTAVGAAITAVSDTHPDLIRYVLESITAAHVQPDRPWTADSIRWIATRLVSPTFNWTALLSADGHAIGAKTRAAVDAVLVSGIPLYRVKYVPVVVKAALKTKNGPLLASLALLIATSCRKISETLTALDRLQESAPHYIAPLTEVSDLIRAETLGAQGALPVPELLKAMVESIASESAVQFNADSTDSDDDSEFSDFVAEEFDVDMDEAGDPKKIADGPLIIAELLGGLASMTTLPDAPGFLAPVLNISGIPSIAGVAEFIHRHRALLGSIPLASLGRFMIKPSPSLQMAQCSVDGLQLFKSLVVFRIPFLDRHPNLTQFAQTALGDICAYDGTPAVVDLIAALVHARPMLSYRPDPFSHILPALTESHPDFSSRVSRVIDSLTVTDDSTHKSKSKKGKVKRGACPATLTIVSNSASEVAEETPVAHWSDVIFDTIFSHSRRLIADDVAEDTLRRRFKSMTKRLAKGKADKAAEYLYKPLIKPGRSIRISGYDLESVSLADILLCAFTAADSDPSATAFFAVWSRMPHRTPYVYKAGTPFPRVFGSVLLETLASPEAVQAGLGDDELAVRSLQSLLGSVSQTCAVPLAFDALMKLPLPALDCLSYLRVPYPILDHLAASGSILHKLSVENSGVIRLAIMGLSYPAKHIRLMSASILDRYVTREVPESYESPVGSDLAINHLHYAASRALDGRGDEIYDAPASFEEIARGGRKGKKTTSLDSGPSVVFRHHASFYAAAVDVLAKHDDKAATPGSMGSRLARYLESGLYESTTKLGSKLRLINDFIKCSSKMNRVDPLLPHRREVDFIYQATADSVAGLADWGRGSDGLRYAATLAMCPAADPARVRHLTAGIRRSLVDPETVEKVGDMVCGVLSSIHTIHGGPVLSAVFGSVLAMTLAGGSPALGDLVAQIRPSLRPEQARMLESIRGEQTDLYC
ncbi:hypothetical protein J8273_1998 [Carpediemonas membranifera]|uniref:Uncharacterized protein n=1 Tax=Carpediemonas membranifera TaxID=201153 RepID=A0A8J6BFB0_9EUKA|nr:hypothetical protein J8273_1998 [Carpediemonas membranifera]|eukprot:KAG9396267.1 hypothetical protein J8273_1998 [Carpediemonas membranifera]